MILSANEFRAALAERHYGTAGDPAPDVETIVRVEQGAPGARFYLADRNTVDIGSAERRELLMRSDASWYARYVAPWAGAYVPNGGSLWAVGAAGNGWTVLDHIAVPSVTTTYLFGVDGKFRRADSMPGWVAPVAIVGVVGAIGAAVILSR